MKILVLAIPYDHGRSGISVYIREIIRELTAQGHQLTLVLEQEAAADFSSYRKIILPERRPLISMLRALFLLPWTLPYREFDFCLIPAANRRCLGRFPIFTIAVVHDLSQYHIPAKYDAFRMFYIRHLLPFFVRRAPAVCAISPSTAEDLIRYWQLEPARISVVSNGLSLSPESSSSAPSVCCRPYILYISRLEHPGKNHLNLLKAFELLPPEIREHYDLLCPGASWNSSDAILDYARQSACRDHFHFPGFVAAESLPSLYQHASLYVFPSFYEGFGLSLIEAMHYGIPCACSNVSSLKDIGNHAAALFDPASPQDISSAINRILTDDGYRQQLTDAGKIRAGQFSWAKTVRGLLGIYQRPQAELLRIPFFAGSMQEALNIIDEQITAAENDGRCRRIHFVNAHCLNLSCTDPEYRQILQNADRIFADGSGVRIGAVLRHYHVRENVNGTDLYPLLLQRKHSIYLLGGAPGIAEQAAVNSRKLCPDCKISGWHDGFFAGREEQVLKDINSAQPDILLVAMGVPAQEKWIENFAPRLKCRVAIGVGGLFDFVSDRIPRAPAWLRRLGLEWTFRLYQEPRRLFRRYIIGNPLFLLRIIVSACRPAAKNFHQFTENTNE